VLLKRVGPAAGPDLDDKDVVEPHGEERERQLRAGARDATRHAARAERAMRAWVRRSGVGRRGQPAHPVCNRENSAHPVCNRENSAHPVCSQRNGAHAARSRGRGAHAPSSRKQSRFPRDLSG